MAHLNRSAKDMRTALKMFPLASLVAVGFLGLAGIGQLIAITSDKMPGFPGYMFVGFSIGGAIALVVGHRDLSRSQGRKKAEIIVGSIAGAAFLGVSVYSFFEKV